MNKILISSMKIEAYLINLKSRPDRLKSFFNQKMLLVCISIVKNVNNNAITLRSICIR